MKSSIKPDDVQLRLLPHSTADPFVGQLAESIRTTLGHAVLFGIMHGSFGNNDLVAYSDVDALLVFRDSFYVDGHLEPQLARKLQRIQKLFYQYDPLQHHGFFVLPESALDRWPENYLPVAALANGTVFTQSTPLDLTLQPFYDLNHADHALHRIADGIMGEVASARYLAGMYQLKSMLSKTMLLPAMYVQSRDGRGVFKKDSFEIARGDFSSHAWSAIEEASEVRLQWPTLRIRRPHSLFGSPTRWGHFARRRFGYAIPRSIRAKLTTDFRESVTALATEAKQLILELRESVK